MRNMEELQLAWSRWKPERYKKIDIIPDTIVDARRGPGPEKAIAAFSGDVDATFTALRHTRVLPERTRYPLQSLLMVHGLDVSLDNSSDFQKLVARVRPLIDDLNLDLRIVRTNSKDLGSQLWDDSFGLEVAGCLHMFADEFDYGLMGSSESYDALVIPWGATPITDHFMSGYRFSIIHDGAGFSRTDKVAALQHYPVACRTLKVCWEGADQGTNCGQCEKCIRTQLNFLAAGAKTMPPCFPGELDINRIRDIKISNIAQWAELASIAAYAEARKVTAPWCSLLKERIAQWKRADAAKRRNQQIRKTVVKQLAQLGIEKPTKKVWQCVQAPLKAMKQ